jgi:hypothetical protein
VTWDGPHPPVDPIKPRSITLPPFRHCHSERSEESPHFAPIATNRPLSHKPQEHGCSHAERPPNKTHKADFSKPAFYCRHQLTAHLPLLVIPEGNPLFLCLSSSAQSKGPAIAPILTYPLTPFRHQPLNLSFNLSF